MLHIENFSREYAVKCITRSDVPQVFSLCKENKQYYQHFPPFVTEQSILDDLKALPQGKSIEDKYFIGFYSDDQLIAVMDLIDRYPNESTAFIGFFMTDVAFQHRGIGTMIVDEISQYLKNLEYRYIRLAWIKGNVQSETFWHKNGFLETGFSYETNGCTVIVAQREL